MNLEREEERKGSFPRSIEEIERELLSAEMLWAQAKDQAKIGDQEVISKWQDVILNANPHVVHRELERLLELLALQENVIVEQGLLELLERRQKESRANAALQAKLLESKKNLAMESMGKILSSE